MRCCSIPADADIRRLALADRAEARTNRMMTQTYRRKFCQGYS
jgi:hypothetical protein